MSYAAYQQVKLLEREQDVLYECLDTSSDPIYLPPGDTIDRGKPTAHFRPACSASTSFGFTPPLPHTPSAAPIHPEDLEGEALYEYLCRWSWPDAKPEPLVEDVIRQWAEDVYIRERQRREELADMLVEMQLQEYLRCVDEDLERMCLEEEECYFEFELVEDDEGVLPAWYTET